MPILAITFYKAPLDIRVFGIDYGDFAELVGGDTISSATVNADAGITVQTPSVSGSIVLFQVSGGSLGTVYRLDFSANLASGAVLEAFVDIIVIVPSRSS